MMILTLLICMEIVRVYLVFHVICINLMKTFVFTWLCMAETTGLKYGFKYILICIHYMFIF